MTAQNIFNRCRPIKVFPSRISCWHSRLHLCADPDAEFKGKPKRFKILMF